MTTTAHYPKSRWWRTYSQTRARWTRKPGTESVTRTHPHRNLGVFSQYRRAPFVGWTGVKYNTARTIGL